MFFLFLFLWNVSNSDYLYFDQYFFYWFYNLRTLKKSRFYNFKEIKIVYKIIAKK